MTPTMTILWTNKSWRQASRLSRDIQRRIDTCLKRLQETGIGLQRCSEIRPDEYRLRCGDYRIILNRNEGNVFIVRRISYRDKAYR